MALDLRSGDRVRDTWWPDNVGRVLEVLKTRVVVRFTNEDSAPAMHGGGNPVSYDYQHARAFLRRA